MRFPRLKTAALAVAAAVLVVGGCDSSATLAPLPLNGTGDASYTLATVNAAPLPVDVRNDASGRVSIVQGSLVLGGAATFRQSFTISETPAGGTASLRQSVTEGTITISGNQIQFRSTTGGEWQGVMTGSQINYVVPGNSSAMAFSFQRG